MKIKIEVKDVGGGEAKGKTSDGKASEYGTLVGKRGNEYSFLSIEGDERQRTWRAAQFPDHVGRMMQYIERFFGEEAPTPDKVDATMEKAKKPSKVQETKAMVSVPPSPRGRKAAVKEKTCAICSGKLDTGYNGHYHTKADSEKGHAVDVCCPCVTVEGFECEFALAGAKASVKANGRAKAQGRSKKASAVKGKTAQATSKGKASKAKATPKPTAKKAASKKAKAKGGK